MRPIVQRRVIYGAAAAFCATAVALDTQIGEKHNFPVWRLVFGTHWDAAHNLSYAIFALGAATFGYLALNVRNGNGNGEHKKE